MSLSRLRNSLTSATPYLALTCFGMAAAPALAQDSADQNSGEESPTMLGGVTVTDTAIDESFLKEEISSPKFTQPIQDTPQTVQIIDRDLFQQQGATTLTEALRNTPGVGTFYAGENGNTTTGDAIRMRGFDTASSIFVDGIRDLGTVSRDIFNTEQIEVVKGPAGTDNGRSAPTGAINLVSKRAYMDDSLSGILSVGVDGQKRGTADANHMIDGLGGAALRLNLLVQDSDVPGRDHVTDQRFGVAPSFGIGLDGSTRAWINLLYVEQDNVPDGHVPTIGLDSWSPYPGQENLIGNPVDSSNFYGTRADYEDVNAKMATFIVEHDISDNVRLTNSARWGRTDQKYLLTAFLGRDSDITCSDPSNLGSCTIARFITTNKDTRNEILTDQLNLRADFTTGAVEHNLTVGAEYANEKLTSYGLETTGTRPDANLYDPSWNDAGSLDVSHNGAVSKGETDTLSFYLFDTAKFFDDVLQVTGGIRLDHYKTTYFSTGVCNGRTSGRGAVPCYGGVPVGSIVTTNDLKAKDTLFNWKLGALVKPVPSLSFYANYAISQQPPGGDNFSLSSSQTSANNPNLKAQKAKTIEAGVKWSGLDDRLLATAAIFQTKVDNEINRDDPSDIQSGSKRVRGVEVSLVGNITDAWSISAGYTHLNTKVTNGSAITSDGSNNLTYSPDDAFTSWTNYRLPFGLEIGGGVRYVSGLHRGTDGAVGTPVRTDGYTVVDALLAYPVTENIKLRMNAYNLFDKDYIASINKSGYRYSPGTPQTFLFSADFRF